MAKIRIQRTHEFEGGEVKLAEGVLYVDGKKVMDFPDRELRLETEGQVSVSSDVPVMTTTQQGGGGSAAASASAASGKGGSVHVSTGDPELAEKIAKDVHDKVGNIGEKVAEKVKESLEQAFPPGFPFHDRK